MISTFVDWRPIASIPIENGLLASSTWIAFEKSRIATLLDAADLAEFDVEYRYVCRQDGFILFEIDTPEIDGRLAVEIAYRVSHKIKEECGHCHVADRPDRMENRLVSDLTSFPVLAEHVNQSAFVDFEKFAMDDERLSNLRAKSVATNFVVERKALLTIKKLYSRLFDRVSKRVEEHDRAVHPFALQTSTPRGSHTIALICIGLPLVWLLLWYLDHLFGWASMREITLGAVFVWGALLTLVHVRHHLNNVLVGKILLHRRLISYLCHGNNLSRALWKIYPDAGNGSPSNDYDPIIRLTEDVISATIRRMNSYTFYFGALVSIFGLLITIVG